MVLRGGCTGVALQSRVLANPPAPVTVEIRDSENGYDDYIGRATNLITTGSCQLRGAALGTDIVQFISSQCDLPPAVRCANGELAELSGPGLSTGGITVLMYLSGNSARGLVSELWKVSINGEPNPEGLMYLSSKLELRRVSR
jgi:hypothetical protein